MRKVHCHSRKMWQSMFWLVSLLCESSVGLSGYQDQPPHPPVTTVAQGRVRGRWFTTRGGRSIAGFLGIPYAKPPVGPLRFKSPQPADAWDGELDATKDGLSCIQEISSAPGPIRPSAVSQTSEDCLNLNVYTPWTVTGTSKRDKLPVLIFIFGGSFQAGYANSTGYGPDYLLDEDICLVTFNYRQGILGYLALESPVVPGNLGLKDQRAVFRWVRDNIAQFGCDPGRVTIFGQSAGAVSVQIHLIFTANEGIFRAGIADSGAARSGLGLQYSEETRDTVRRLVAATGCPRDPALLVECLRQLPAQDFVELNNKLRKTSLDIKNKSPLFRPVIEPCSSPDAVITADPWDRIIDLPMLLGCNEFEGLFRTSDYQIDSTDKKFMELNNNYETVLPFTLYFDYTAENPKEVAKTLKYYYFGNKTIDRKHYINFVDLVSDAIYNYPVVASTRASTGKIFFYQFNYRGSNTYVHYQGSTAYYGVSHVDELFFLFPFGGPSQRNITTADTAVSRRIVKMWTNFAKYLDPTPQGHPVQWYPVTSPCIEYLSIDQHDMRMKTNFLRRRMAFWSSLPYRNKVSSPTNILGNKCSVVDRCDAYDMCP